MALMVFTWKKQNEKNLREKGQAARERGGIAKGRKPLNYPTMSKEELRRFSTKLKRRRVKLRWLQGITLVLIFSLSLYYAIGLLF